MLIVAYSILGRPIGKLVEKVKDVNWKGLADSAIAAFVLKKVQGKITPEIEAAVTATLNEWFGSSAPAAC